ncbi:MULTISPECIES: helix-turn-helix domain-containing protein [Flavobacterium]|uniref:AraC family transcriptional regulator n=1 Tax=Flavobacterium keumense TaxID=1306518 RepID=A0ABY8N4V6_9FLAO|nr:MULTISPECIES: helix-turn-helix domain-containing protein [Flavobacterium]WGK94289.1 AraC family transcriptional regulator [Flavobacterium keumense]
MLSIALFKIQNNSFIEELLRDYNNLLIIIVPCSYLYFENLIKDCKTIYFRNFVHLIIPLVFNIIDYLLDQNYFDIQHVDFYYYTFFTLYTIFYYALIYKILYKNVWNRKGEIEVVIKQNQLIRKWSIYLFSFLIIVGARVILILFWEINNNNYAYATSYQWIPSLFWLILYFKIIISPEILYGYNYLNAKINEHKKINNATIAFWTSYPITEINNIQDNQLNEKIKNSIVEYMKEVDQFSFHNQAYRDAKFSLTDLSNKLNIPKSHLSFLFKYHSKISFPEYKKIVRIYDGLELIDAGYLKTNTYESLAKEIGFTSYNTFFVSFKDVTGVSPQEFLIRLLKQKRFN